MGVKSGGLGGYIYIHVALRNRYGGAIMWSNVTSIYHIDTTHLSVNWYSGYLVQLT